MSCKVDPASGQLVYTFEGKAKYTNPLEYGDISSLSTDGSYRFIVPCRKCLGCQIDYSRDWANRMIIELQDNSSAIFLTLTYNNEHLPISSKGYSTLCKEDLQLFWKRLRKHFPGKRIRYYIAGEYGPTTFRPHYHAIVYGIGLSDFPDISYRGCNERKDPFYSSPTMERIWSNGFILMSDVTWKTCAYVARYVLKKQGKASDFHLSRDSVPEFNLSSRRPGIGLLHSRDYVLSGNNMFDLDGRDGVHSVSLPKSMLRNVRRIEQIDVDKINDIVYNRSMDAAARLRSNLLFSEKSFKDFLESKEFNLAGKIKLLPERSSI
ncbi:MAG: replication initiator protein [Microviridae sp.]|nr:MAG: replication initiator protein [Microviridae sp.]